MNKLLGFCMIITAAVGIGLCLTADMSTAEDYVVYGILGVCGFTTFLFGIHFILRDSQDD